MFSFGGNATVFGEPKQMEHCLFYLEFDVDKERLNQTTG